MSLLSLTVHRAYGTTPLHWVVLVLAVTNVIYASTMLWNQSIPRLTTPSASVPSIATNLRNFSESDVHLTSLLFGAALNVSTAFVRRGYPRGWSIGPLQQVHMPQEDTVHYALDTPTGSAEWETMLPGAGDGLIYLGPERHPFSISLFHQLRCLNILRKAIVSGLKHVDHDHRDVGVQSELVRHCMGYIRQMILCRSDLRLENVRIPRARSVTNSDVTHTCKDWQAVYVAAERNNQEYAAEVRSNSSQMS
jgi:hypothetical protein